MKALAEGVSCTVVSLSLAHTYEAEADTSTMNTRKACEATVKHEVCFKIF